MNQKGPGQIVPSFLQVGGRDPEDVEQWYQALTQRILEVSRMLQTRKVGKGGIGWERALQSAENAGLASLPVPAWKRQIPGRFVVRLIAFF
jgi:hypothetical protein